MSLERLSSAFFSYYRGISELEGQIGIMLSAAIDSGRSLRAAQTKAPRLITQTKDRTALFESLIVVNSLITKAANAAQRDRCTRQHLGPDRRPSARRRHRQKYAPRPNNKRSAFQRGAFGGRKRHPPRPSVVARINGIYQCSRAGGYDPDDFDAEAPYDRQQARSIRVLIRALHLSGKRLIPARISLIKALELLSEGSPATFIRRLYDLGEELGETNSTTQAARMRCAS
jgi:hypothetical protein